MGEAHELSWQPSLFAAGGPAFDPGFEGLSRRELAEGAWVDHCPGWVRGADGLFAVLLEHTPLRQRTTVMYDRRVAEPRLTHRWRLDVTEEAPGVPLLAELAAALSARYGVAFTQVGVNLYRDGRDSVAWHGDRVARELPTATVALISLGEPRPFRLRPKGGGTSIGYLPGPGDLLVMGGSCQRTWDHAVPKVRSAGPRMSVQFRHAYDRAGVPGRGAGSVQHMSGDKREEHTPDAPAPARPGETGQDKAGTEGDTPTRPDGAVEEG